MSVINNYLFKSRYQLIILIVVALGLNINTIFNDYAVDDSIVLTKNNFVKKGISGIPEILSEGYFKGSQTGQAKEFSGGRFRPLTLVIFAVEYQFFGSNPFVSHSINVVLFLLLIGFLYLLLEKYIFKENNPLLTFLTCLIFVVHPIHTEVIANVKGRDELVAFLILIVSVILFLKYLSVKKTGLLITGLLCFFLALLAKETSVTFVAIIPLLLYFFYNFSLKKSILFSMPFVFVFFCYLILRFLIVGANSSEVTDIMNAPFSLATTSQAFATKVFILYKYLYLLVYPYPLSWEYGYNQIPYIEINSYKFILSLSLIISLIAYAFYKFKEKSLISFSILYFFISIILVANFLVDIGTPLSERFLFQPSLAICIVLAVLFLKISEKFKMISISILSLLITLFCAKTFVRNLEWKDQATLFIADVKSSPNSLRANGAALNVYFSKALDEKDTELKKLYYKNAIHYAERMRKIYDFHQNTTGKFLLIAYGGLFDCYQSLNDFLNDNNFDPSSTNTQIIINILSETFYKDGNLFYHQGNVSEAIIAFHKSVLLNKNNLKAWYNLGGCYFVINDTLKANSAWDNVKTADQTYHFNKEDFIRN